MSFFLIKPSVLPVELTRGIIGDPIYEKFKHALGSYSLTIMISIPSFVFFSAVELRFLGKKGFCFSRLIVRLVLSSLSFWLDQVVSIARLTNVDCVYCVVLPRLAVFVGCLFVINVAVMLTVKLWLSLPFTRADYKT